jgi:ComF family protein
MSLIESAIRILAPPECVSCGAEGAPLCNTCSLEFIKPFGERCWRCSSISPGGRTCSSCRHAKGPKYAWIVTDHNNIARDLLSLYKFRHQRAAADSITDMMAVNFQKYGKYSAQDYIIVPVPTATKRTRERGFGHAELLANRLASKLGLQYCEALRRLDQTRQLGSRREDRLKQLSSSFAAKNNKQAAGRNILLIDDVVTTGGTLIAATKALRTAGAKQVDALLFAKRL